MPPCVVTGGQAQCTFGLAPTSIVALPMPRVFIEGRPAATIADNQGLVNLPTFGMCTSLSNPQVAAATTAALGVLTPMPCQPVIVSPWSPGAAKTLVGGKPALTMGSSCQCAWGGHISVIMAGSMRTSAS